MKNFFEQQIGITGKTTMLDDLVIHAVTGIIGQVQIIKPEQVTVLLVTGKTDIWLMKDLLLIGSLEHQKPIRRIPEPVPQDTDITVGSLIAPHSS